MFKLGSLQILPVLECRHLLAPNVFQAIGSFAEANKIGATEIDPALSDTAAFCQNYSVGMERAANCVVLEARRGDKSWFAACLVLGTTRADVNGVARRTLDARKVSFASMEKAVLQTGMEYGAITPLGLPPEWPILIDKRVVECDYVIIGSGLRKSKIVIPGNLLASLPNAQVLEGLGLVREAP